ncbi:MAG TPA: 5-oxoprolinase subunit PxpB [Chthoniobacterales bacterium]|nr:5-oxoprolinase subunit PxpB [Chthoniobacterales bacterium]
MIEISPLGDSVLLIRIAENFDAAPEDALNKVLGAKRSLEVAKIPGVIEIAPAYATAAIFYDPVRAIDAGVPAEEVVGWFERRIREALSKEDFGRADRGEKTPIEIPVCYESEFAFDLEDLARRAGLDLEEVVDLHCGAEYRVHCVGFTAGFPFLGGMPRKLATPRRDVPRKAIPAGSVAIGGAQTGIYPVKSPGGWNVIGRTPLRLFDPQKDPPALLRAGDRVRFRSITREEFERSTT